jgi:HrpA-like RNA helicase
MSESTNVGDKLEECEELPIKSFKQEIVNAIKTHQIIICLGETGSGKLLYIPV